MRKLHVMKGDMVFQWKYGFYLLYVILCVIYMMIFSFFTGTVRNTIVSICVYSDPAAMGMFFMGALILLEKSQRIINSLAVSPVTTEEYIFGKVLSIGLISVLVGMLLMSQGHTDNYVLCGVGIFLGSEIFSLCGIIVGAKITGLNQYIVYTIPFEVVGFVPVILYRIGWLKDQWFMLIHPGCSVMQLIEGNRLLLMPALLSCFIWIIVLFIWADFSVRKMFEQSEETKL